MGKETRGCERLFADYVSVKDAVAVKSGSPSNLPALTALVEGGEVKQGSEVIVSSATFTTVVSPIIHAGLKPAVVDVDPKTCNIAVAAW